MEVNLPYIFRVALALTVFYTVYFTLFREGKNFLFKRIYFVAAALMSITIPMLSFQVEVVAQNEPLTFVTLSSYIQSSAVQSSAFDIRFVDNREQQAESIIQTICHHISQFGWSGIMWVLFALGVAGLLLRMLMGHFKIRKVVKNASLHTLYGNSVWVTTEKFPPFAYFRKVVIPAGILDSPYLQAVISHERIHARGWHCLDLYMADILCILQWFNPFAWLLKRAVKDNIEFLTDCIVTRQMNQDEYQMGMVSIAGRDMVSAFPAASNISQLKKRIEMMEKVKSIRYQWARVLLLMPVIAFLTITLSGREVCIVESARTGFVEGTEEWNVTEEIAPDTSLIFDQRVTEKIGATNDISVISRQELNESTIGITMPTLDHNLTRSGVDIPVVEIEPMNNVKAITLKERKALNLYGENSVIVVETEGVSEQNLVGNVAKKRRPDMVFTMSDTSNVHYVFDGKIYAPGRLDLNTIQANIRYIEILDDKTAKAKYGVAPVYFIKKGKNPTRPIFIKLNTPLASYQNRTDTTSNYTTQLQDRINNRESIKRVTVSKDTTKYSDKNVILVENRDNPSEPVELALSDGGMPAFVSGSGVILTVPDKVLYMVDGKKMASLNNFEADIVSFAILKKEKAVELYGESGENGVIAVKTK